MAIPGLQGFKSEGNDLHYTKIKLCIHQFVGQILERLA